MAPVPFSIKMAWRETHASWRQFLFFFVCIAIGVSAVVSVGLFAANVEQVILQDARSLLGGDLQVSLTHRLTDAGQSVIDSLRERDVETTHVSELVAMAAAVQSEDSLGDQTQLVELKAVEDGYPFYGRVQVDPPRPLTTLVSARESECSQAQCYGAVVQESFLIGMGVPLGSQIKIGQAFFIIRGVLLKEPDRVASAFSLGPRVMISREALRATDLVKPGSRIRERYLLRVPESLSLAPLVGELRGRLVKERVRVSTYQEAQPRVRRFLDQLAIYLGLIGLTALFVGGIGVACTVQGFIAQKMTNIAILKTLGSEAGLIIRTYLFQTFLMGAIGSVIGTIVGVGIHMILPSVLQDIISLHMTSQFFLMPLVKGIALGMLTTVLFTLWPLLVVRQIPPALVFRRDVQVNVAEHALDRPIQWMKMWLMNILVDRHRLVMVLIMGVGLAALAVWQAGSLTLGLLFICAFVVALILLQGVAKVLMHFLPLIPMPRSFVVRQAMGNLRRPGSQAVNMAVAVGVGVMVIVAISLIKTSLLLAIGDRIPDDAPAFFFIDIQPDQKEGFQQLVLNQAGDSVLELTPVVRTRLSAIDGQKIDPEAYKDKRNGWYFTREYVLTSLVDLPTDNVITKGAWWPNPVSATSESERAGAGLHVQVSIEEQAAKNLGVNLGSSVEFDIQGTTLSADVSSVRKVDWSSFSTNFFMILSPDSLEGAPLTYIATARMKPEEEVPIQRAVVAAFPNVTAIKIGDVLANVTRLLQQLASAIQGIALFCILAGAIVMTTALSTTKYRRLYEAAILKAVGGTRHVIVRAFAVEFAVVGALAGAIGVGLASVLSWVVLRFFLDLPWTLQPDVLGMGFILTVVLALLVGFLSTFRILGESTLAVLRQE